MTKVYTTGVFDMLHPGHIRTLRRAKELGTELVVGIQEDESVLEQKRQLPTMSVEERKYMLESLSFVDEVCTYSNTDQIEMLKKIKPDVMVQTNEWAQQTDRSKTIQFLKDNGIELTILPIIKDLSTTTIKKRVIKNANLFRNDINLLTSRLKITPIKKLDYYEMNDPKRVDKLLKKISEDGVFFNPITIGKMNDKYIILDGMNRFMVARKLGWDKIFTYEVNYSDDVQIELQNNTHFLSIALKDFFKLLKDSSLEYEKIDKNDISDKKLKTSDKVIFLSDNYYYQISSKNLSIDEISNKVVESYLGKVKVSRLSELNREDRGYSLKIIFPKFTKQYIYDLVSNNKMLQSGITWHQVRDSVIRFSVPNSQLETGTSLNSANVWLENEINKKINTGNIRYYPSNIYVCDEFDKY